MELNKKKIAVICDYKLLPERVGGMDYFFWEFDKKCKENNIHIDWFFPNKSSHGTYSELNIISSNHQEPSHFFLNYIQATNCSYDKLIFHFVELCTPVFKEIKQNSKARIIAVDHNPRPLDGYSFTKKIRKKIKGFLYSKYIDEFIGVSDYTVNEIIRDFGRQVKSKTTTIYNGVLIEDIKVRLQRNFTNPEFVVVSHLRESKGIQDLIEAVYLLESSIIEQVKITVYGDGPYKEELLKKISNYNLQKVFEFKGSVSDVKELYNKYDYLLQPTHMECFSLSILESLAANVPVITTAVGGNEEVIRNGENGIIFKAKDTIALAQIILSVVKGDLKIISNTRKEIEDKFSLEKMVENYYKLLL